MHSSLAAKAVLLSVLLRLAESSQQVPLGKDFVKSLLNAGELSRQVEASKETFRRNLSAKTPTFLNQHRRFGAVGDSAGSAINEPACDASFISCSRDEKCMMCFLSMQAEGVDWASVTPDTPCSDVTQILFNANLCKDMKGNSEAMDAFCSTFDNCVVWEDDFGADDDEVYLDCDALTECKWDGMYKAFIGDGLCHEGIDCYNHPICGFDGGDCCEDTCDTLNSSFYLECGMEGYACRDPESEKCDPRFTSACPKKGGDKPAPAVECKSDETPYRLEMYDSFGDGWDDTKLILSSHDNQNNVLFQGGLKNGTHGTEYLCLSTEPACYHVKVSGGIWGNEVSWEVKPMLQGSPAVADGGSPMDCEFNIGAELCMQTCDGKPNKEIKDDPDYRAYKQMMGCMVEKCVIQLETCKDDKSCVACLTDNAPEYCFANANFNAAADCGLCHCADGDEEDLSDFCKDKAAPGAIVPVPEPGQDPSTAKPCTAAQTLQGSSAVLAFSKCSNVEEISMMVTEYDQSNFGALDAFESCAHSYRSESMHGGKTALGCMMILSNAIKDPTAGIDNPKAPAEAIKALAEKIYHNAEDFCDCARSASRDCPLCPSFLHLKTLLYESLDACEALDEIDCDAWKEYYTPCKNNMRLMFGNVNFQKKEQCDYAQNGCGGELPFPAFRKLDCGHEIPKEAWDFYNEYERGCLKGGDSPKPNPSTPQPTPKPNPATTPAPTPASQPSTPSTPEDNSQPSATPKPYSPPDGSKPYTPKEQRKRKGHFFRNLFILLLLAGGAYWYYKRQSGSFDFVHYRRARNYVGDTEMYSSLAMDSVGEGSSSFEPPSLPPTPMAVGGDMT